MVSLLYSFIGWLLTVGCLVCSPVWRVKDFRAQQLEPVILLPTIGDTFSWLPHSKTDCVYFQHPFGLVDN